MATRVRDHISSNVWGIAAMFVALTGTAYASHPGGANTISTGDIINDQVFTQDLANNNMTSLDIRDDTLGSGGLQAIDLRDDSVGTSEIAADAVAGGEIADAAVGGAEIADAAVGAADLATDAIPADVGAVTSDGSTKIADDAVAASEIIMRAVGASEIDFSAVGSDELAANSVRASEIGDILVDRLDPFPTIIPGGGAHNGAYNVEASTAHCNAGEELIGGSARWSPDDLSGGDHELFIGSVVLDHAAESVRVEGGNDSGVDHALYAVATCWDGE